MKEQRRSPLHIKLSFHKLMEQYQAALKRETDAGSKKSLEKLISYVSSFPPLTQGLDTPEDLENYKAPVKALLDDLFPRVFSHHEIKALNIPFHHHFYHPTGRFQKILEQGGKDFKLTMRTLDEDLEYIFCCILILNTHYGYTIDFSRTLYYDIPDDKGILRHYRIDLNLDFMEILPTKKSVEVSEEEVDELIQDLENIELWKKKFPPHSWMFKGFSIINLTDVTIDEAVSDLKSALLYRQNSVSENLVKFEEIFRSIYKIPDLKVGFTLFNEQETSFERMDKKSTSFILDTQKHENCSAAMCEELFQALIRNQENFIIPDVAGYTRKNPNILLSRNLIEKGAKTAILAPIAKNNKLLGILELVSFRKNELNSRNAIKLEALLPYIFTAVERNQNEFENRVKAVIQSECTSIHPSVLWVFEKEARNYIKDMEEDGLAVFKDIVLEDVYPLYGQIDIVASSEERNIAIQKDLLFQLKEIESIIKDAYKMENLPIYEQVKFRIKEYKIDLEENLTASSEQKVADLVKKEINPLMDHLQKISPQLEKKVKRYREKVNPETGILYNHRKDYDESVQQVNRTMARYIDQKQVEAQKIFPHYFERYKTDGVEHNIYIGGALNNDQKKPFDKIYLYNLRLWQLSSMCEMENRFYQLQEELPLSLDAASLILAFSSTLSIRYRMDEKKFDVDGTYNARYEIIKKRLDKACVKGTEERLTQKGKIAIIYSQRNDEREYLRYIKYLQAKKYLGKNVELLEVEDVQGVIGLKAIRVEILYHLEKTSKEEIITYEDLIKELN